MTPTKTCVAALAAAAAAGLGGACTSSDDDSAARTSGETTRTGPAETATAPAGSFESVELIVVDGNPIRTAWTLGNRVYGVGRGDDPKRLAGVVQSSLAGTLAPAASQHLVDKQLLVYNSFHRERPVLRLFDATSGRDRIVDEGTYTFAWRRDGALAYFKGLDARVRDPVRHRGHVVVRMSPAAATTRWTRTPGRYAVSAWAGDRLLVHERTQAWPHLVVFDAPGERRVIAERAGLIAVSPDGRRAFVTREPDPSPIVAVVDIATGEEVARFVFSGEVDAVGGRLINYVSDAGSWTGDVVIAAATGSVAVFRVTDDEIVLEQLLGLDPVVFPLGASEPRSDETGRYFAAGAELMQRPRAAFARTGQIECDRIRARCRFSRTAPAFQPPRVVYNPSRP